jgi:DNA-binding beta-propeller fold protein YncE
MPANAGIHDFPDFGFIERKTLKLRLATLLAFVTLAAAHAQTASYHLIATVPLGGGIKWDYLHFDAPSDRVYVSHGDEVTVVNGATLRVIGNLTGLPGSHGIGVDPATGLVYADSADNSDVVMFDPKTLKPVGSAPVLLDADGINYDPASRQMFVSGGDGNGFTPVSTITRKAGPEIPLGSSPEFHVADGAGNEYVDLVDASQIAVIDTKTDSVTAHWPTGACQHPKGAAIDPVTSRFYASCANGESVIFNTATGKIIASFAIGKGTDAADFDPARQLFFASCGDGTLTIIQEKSADDFVKLAILKTAPGARTMALDPATGRIFLVTATVTKTIPPADPSDHPHYVFAPGSLKLLVYTPVLP